MANLINDTRDEMVQEQQDTVLFRNHKRTTEDLRTWLRQHTLLRSQARASGMHDDGGGFMLLEQANLDTTQKKPKNGISK